ncbi:hypothetical protein [Thermodesulfobacterium commune]|uniref:O-antigen polymerase n=1 Tax=Thermodesulfobacterium commune DSM 2178 TaxID=289377 RepID=A0A075WV85_9BACT|nr:hypothetical protein [Thermodesulfobacterium commune]AIH04368.1 hypothetical protein HL41_06300 [Thermodesulfobacterium commune DSM 2178]
MKKKLLNYIKNLVKIFEIQKMTIKINKIYILSLLLTFYSLLPGVAKVTGNSLYYSFYIPIIFFIYLIFRKNKLYLSHMDIPFLISFFLLILYIPISVFILKTVSLEVTIFGVATFLIPMIGYFYSRIIPFNFVVISIVFVGFVHSLIAILLYGFFPLPSFLEDIRSILYEGVMAFRMSSVSGSLVLGALMTIVSVFVLNMVILRFKKEYIILLFIFYFVDIFTMQRSVWISLFIYNILILAYLAINQNIQSKKKLYLIFLLIIFPVLILMIITSVLEYYIDFLLERFVSLIKGEAIEERSSLWRNGLNNFLSIPSGTGLGTVGQVRRILNLENDYLPVLDGDYFRILSETGIILIPFYIRFFIYLVLRGFYLYKMSINRLTVYLSLLGLSINMIGSNTTEFYFVNFIYWLMMGYFWDSKFKN